MSRELVVKKCLKCGAIVKVLKDCNCPCGIECCGEEMKAIVPNSFDAAVLLSACGLSFLCHFLAVVLYLYYTIFSAEMQVLLQNYFIP